jgi:Nif-specific regulatory protein
MVRRPRLGAELELVTLYEVGKLLTESLDLQRTVRNSLNVLVAHLGMERAVVVMMHDNGRLHLLGAVGLSPEECVHCQFAPGEGITGRIFSAGTPMVGPHAPPRSSTSTAPADRSRYAVPDMCRTPRRGKHTVGVLTGDRDSGLFNDDMLSMIAHLMGTRSRCTT